MFFYPLHYVFFLVVVESHPDIHHVSLLSTWNDSAANEILFVKSSVEDC